MADPSPNRLPRLERELHVPRRVGTVSHLQLPVANSHYQSDYPLLERNIQRR
jgi:hypothetical protein